MASQLDLRRLPVEDMVDLTCRKASLLPTRFVISELDCVTGQKIIFSRTKSSRLQPSGSGLQHRIPKLLIAGRSSSALKIQSVAIMENCIEISCNQLKIAFGHRFNLHLELFVQLFLEPNRIIEASRFSRRRHAELNHRE
jgi:hypothetical protein